MKKLALKSNHYKEIIKAYEAWLEVLGYPEETKYSFPVHVREFLYYLEEHSCLSITHLQESHRDEYESHLKSRKNQVRGGGLESNTINKHYVAINNFMSYLHYHNRNLQTFHFSKQEATSSPIILKETEIQALYEISYERGREGSYYYGQRDRAILAIYYGCGLRLSEGIALDIDDIDFTNQILRVRKGKGGKSREVPIAVKCLEDLKSYVEEGRDWYKYNYKHQKKQDIEEALFLNTRGNRLGRSGIYLRLQKLQSRLLIDKHFSTHSLRHSVATHLLRAGMEIEKIREFLGHNSLESTQLYTHLSYGN